MLHQKCVQPVTVHPASSGTCVFQPCAQCKQECCNVFNLQSMQHRDTDVLSLLRCFSTIVLLDKRRPRSFKPSARVESVTVLEEVFLYIAHPNLPDVVSPMTYSASLNHIVLLRPAKDTMRQAQDCGRAAFPLRVLAWPAVQFVHIYCTF